ncbi:MAG: type II secretion system protein GspL [Pseudomonadota bacterium]
MTDTIVLHFNDLQSDQVSWQPLGKKPSSLAPKGKGSLEEAAEQIKGWRHLAVISSNELFLTKVNIPSKNRQRLIQAIPFTLENNLTEEIDELHFAHDTKSSNGTSVAVVSRRRLSSWLERLNQQELRPRGLFPAVLCLPLTPGNWSVYLGNDLSLVRTDTNSGFAADSDNLSVLLTQALSEVSASPKQLDLFIDPDLSEDDVVSLIEELNIPYHVTTSKTNTTDIFSENLDEKHTINLLQGDYKQIDNKSLKWRRWLPAAVLFAFFIGLSIVSTFLDYSEYRQQSIALSEETKQVFRDAFPEIKRIVDPKVQMEQQLSLLKKTGKVGHADFLTLMAHPAATIKEAKGNSIESISYRDGQLDLKMTLKDLQSLDDIKKQIESQNFLVEIRSANANGNQITSHLRIKRGGV